jgi:mercuric ion transport protein
LSTNNPKLPLIGGITASIGAGLCCVGPFVLVSLGIGGAWVANLTRFEPYRPLFIAVALALFAWAGWKLYRPCAPGEACAAPRVRRRRRLIYWLAALAALALLTGPYWIPLIA